MRRIICLLLITLLIAGCLALSGCDVFEKLTKPPVRGIEDATEVPYEQLGDSSIQQPQSRQPIQSRYAYNALTDGQKKLYDGLLVNMYQVYPEVNDLGLYKTPQVIVDSAVLDVADIRITLRALTDDNPYMFWLSRTFSHMVNEDEMYTAVQAYSSFSPDKVREMRSELDAQINAFYSTVPEGLSDYELEKFTHDYIINHCEYDDSGVDRTEINEQNIRLHSVYGALVDGVCVCEGYGMSMQFLLNGLGVECVTVTGMAFDSASDQSESDAVLHLWNAVKLDGSWYHVDATWDDQTSPHQRYNYFNLADDVMYADHTPSDIPDKLDREDIAENGTENMNFFIPVCGSDEYNYFVYECPHLIYYEDDAIEDAIYRAAEDRAEYITLYVDPEYLDFDDAVDMLFNERPQYYFVYIENVNERLSGYEVDSNNIRYFTNKSRGYITAALNYL